MEDFSDIEKRIYGIPVMNMDESMKRVYESMKRMDDQIRNYYSFLTESFIKSKNINENKKDKFYVYKIKAEGDILTYNEIASFENDKHAQNFIENLRADYFVYNISFIVSTENLKYIKNGNKND